jgi:hypothetical protein
VNGAADPAAGPVTAAAVATGRLPLFFSAGAAAEAALEAAESSCLKMDGNAFFFTTVDNFVTLGIKAVTLF